MKKALLRTYSRLTACILTALGLHTSCDFVEPRAEYGVPSVDFKAKGTVTETQTGLPIPNIRIIGRSRYDRWHADTVYTNEKGEYSLEVKGMFGFPARILAEDTDGDKNLGQFRSDSLLVEKADTRQIKKSKESWYQGAFEKTGADFNLKQETPIPMYGMKTAGFKEIKSE